MAQSIHTNQEDPMCPTFFWHGVLIGATVGPFVVAVAGGVFILWARRDG